MKSFDASCKDFHNVVAEIAAHSSSELGVEIQGKTMLHKLSMFMDLDNWPASPDLVGITDEQEMELREWGPVYTKRLEAFHAKAEELRKDRYKAVCVDLTALGEEMGEEYNFFTSGPLDERIADVLCKADLLRKTQLDGLGYVDVLDPETNFAKGFYKTTKLKRTELFRDLKLCAQSRNDGVVLELEEMVRLGFKVDACNEDR